MSQLVAGLVLLALVPGVWWLMLRGWRRRGAGQSALPAPAAAPTGPDGGDLPLVDAVGGTHVSSVLAGRPLERVVAHGLGTRSPVRVGVVGEGAGAALVVQRPGARSFAVPAADLAGVRRTRGQAGKFLFEKEGLVVVTWRLGGTELDTGVRVAPQADAGRLVETVEALLAARATGGGSGGSAGGAGPSGGSGGGAA